MQEKVHEHSGSRSQGASALEGMAPEEGGRPAEGRLEKAAHGAALMAQDQIEHLMTYRHYPEWAAEEVALKQFILLPPEGDGLEDWEREELAELEREYRKNPPIAF